MAPESRDAEVPSTLHAEKNIQVPHLSNVQRPVGTKEAKKLKKEMESPDSIEKSASKMAAFTAELRDAFKESVESMEQKLKSQKNREEMNAKTYRLKRNRLEFELYQGLIANSANASSEEKDLAERELRRRLISSFVEDEEACNQRTNNPVNASRHESDSNVASLVVSTSQDSRLNAIGGPREALVTKPDTLAGDHVAVCGPKMVENSVRSRAPAPVIDFEDDSDEEGDSDGKGLRLEDMITKPPLDYPESEIV